MCIRDSYTVSQLNRYVAAVANKGTLHKLTLLSKTTDPNGQVIKKYEPVVTSTMDQVSDETWNLLHQGMVAMIEHTPSFTDVGVSVAGKTGTAQQSELHPDHGLFVGFAPVESPEIAVSVRIKNGYTSAYAAEIGRDIIRAKYQPDKIGEIVTGSAAVSYTHLDVYKRQGQGGKMSWNLRADCYIRICIRAEF